MVEASSITVNLELPFAAMIYKEKAKKGITKKRDRSACPLGQGLLASLNSLFFQVGF